jgi:hypothetical protein
MDDDETSLNDALLEICDETRHGTVGGVIFDIRHEDLAPKDWRMEPIGIDPRPLSRPSRNEGQPFLWFPWFGPFIESDVERSIENEIRFLKEKRPNDPAPSVESLRKTYTPDAKIEASDKIVIDRVLVEGERTGLHHEHDAQRRFAYIQIVKPLGSVHSLEEPIVFTGSSAMWTGGYSKMFSKIIQRLCAYHEIESIHDPKVKEIVRRGAQADAAAALLHAAALVRADLDLPNLVKAKIRYMIDEACLVGYRWGRAEADMRMKPLAQAGYRSRAGAPSGGRISGERRRQKAAETWKPLALRLAKDTRQKKPTLSNEALIGVMKNHREGAGKLPGEDSLRYFIRDMIRGGKLPPRKRTSRREDKS